jgi:hypothetical protein
MSALEQRSYQPGSWSDVSDRERGDRCPIAFLKQVLPDRLDAPRAGSPGEVPRWVVQINRPGGRQQPGLLHPHQASATNTAARWEVVEDSDPVHRRSPLGHSVDVDEHCPYEVDRRIDRVET